MIARLASLLLVAAAPLAAQTQALLQDYALPGQHRVVQWTNLSSSNSGLAFNASLSTGAATLSVASPGYQASAGLYSFAGPYSFTATTTAAPFDVSTILLQYVGGHNPDFDARYLTFGGGPLLAYTLADTTTGTLAPTSSAQPAGPVNLTVGPFTADYFGHAWEWDLTSVTGTVVAFAVQVPVPAHTSLPDIRLQFGDTYGAFLASPVPEPSAFAALAGLATLALAATRRRR